MVISRRTILRHPFLYPIEAADGDTIRKSYPVGKRKRGAFWRIVRVFVDPNETSNDKTKHTTTTKKPMALVSGVNIYREDTISVAHFIRVGYIFRIGLKSWTI